VDQQQCGTICGYGPPFAVAQANTVDLDEPVIGTGKRGDRYLGFARPVRPGGKTGPKRQHEDEQAGAETLQDLHDADCIQSGRIPQ